MLRLFLDDVRACPPDFTLCRTAAEAISLLDSGAVTEISFDHDLGGELTGYSVAAHIEHLVWEGRIRCPAWTIHSANPVGADRIEAAMQSALQIESQRLHSGE